MNPTPNRDKAIFLQAMEMKTARERSELLDSECGDDSTLRRQVEELLKSSDEAGRFLDGLAVQAVSNIEAFDTAHGGKKR